MSNTTPRANPPTLLSNLPSAEGEAADSALFDTKHCTHCHRFPSYYPRAHIRKGSTKIKTFARKMERSARNKQIFDLRPSFFFPISNVSVFLQVFSSSEFPQKFCADFIFFRSILLVCFHEFRKNVQLFVELYLFRCTEWKVHVWEI